MYLLLSVSLRLLEHWPTSMYSSALHSCSISLSLTFIFGFISRYTYFSVLFATINRSSVVVVTFFFFIFLLFHVFVFSSSLKLDGFVLRFSSFLGFAVFACFFLQFVFFSSVVVVYLSFILVRPVRRLTDPNPAHNTRTHMDKQKEYMHHPM